MDKGAFRKYDGPEVNMDYDFYLGMFGIDKNNMNEKLARVTKAFYDRYGFDFIEAAKHISEIEKEFEQSKTKKYIVRIYSEDDLPDYGDRIPTFSSMEFEVREGQDYYDALLQLFKDYIRDKG